MFARRLAHTACLMPLLSAPLQAAPISQDEVEFFEARIRPVLAQDCYECHRSKGQRKGGLALDHRRALLQGGESGPVIIAGDPAASRLIQAIRHEREDLKMPKARAKLEASVIADFQEWIRRGAPDPRDAPPSQEVIDEDTNWDAVMQRRKRWWSFQPLKDTPLDQLQGGDDAHPVDRFIWTRLKEAGLEQTDPADGHTLIRRLSFALRGLPPDPEEIAHFVGDLAPDAYENLVDRFLQSPHFGERWARHWMDWVRYADSHGSEGDPTIPYAWRYRDYLIRALNEDVPYDQLAREHLAGDLLERPRINDGLGLNESAIGTAHLRMVFHGFAPTDALDEQVRFTDDQINVVSKAFLGLTLSCARCHNHKFDPISQRDFYAWYGIFASCPPASIAIDAPSPVVEARREELRQMKGPLRQALASAWLDQLPDVAAGLHGEGFAEQIQEAKRPEHLFHPLWALEQGRELQAALEPWKRPAPKDARLKVQWDFTLDGALEKWRQDGRGARLVEPPGTFAVAPEGDDALTGIYPSGVYSHPISSKDRGVLLSPRVMLDGEYELWLHLAGDDGALARYVVQNYPRDGTVYPVERLNGASWRWKRFNLDYWLGDHIHVEITTAADQPILANTGASRSWFGVRRVVLAEKGSVPERDEYGFSRPLLRALGEGQPLVGAYIQALETCLRAWERDGMSDEEALFLAGALRVGLLSNQLADLPAVKPLVEAYRELEAKLPVPTRAPGVLEKDAFDQPFFERGNHKQPGDPVPRHFLDAIDGAPYQTSQSGRLALADDLFRPDNPLTSRVIVNRVWHHLFGEGLVRTPDNFGRLGREPSHPALLDHLALWFRDGGYSIKALIRYLVTCETWRASSTPPAGATARDPDNLLLSHAHVRRLEAEAIRDALLAVSGALERESMYGPPADGDSPRRSVYLRVRRNALHPFLSVFDVPVPASTKGRRDVTNVPGQSLTMLNDGFVLRMAHRWAERLEREGEEDRLEAMFLQVVGRPPTPGEVRQAREFVAASEADRRERDGQRSALQAKAKRLDHQLATLTETVTRRVLEERGTATGTAPALLPPIASWDFDDGLQDSVGSLHGTAHGKARVKDGYLLLEGDGSYVSTPLLPETLREKTLEARVQLKSYRQRGGGVITVQDATGITFDAIVYGEREPRRWMAGSEGFKRTKSFGGHEEAEAKDTWIHLAIVYSSDGTITGYRQGEPYGKPYQSGGLKTFEQAQVLFGLRHGQPDGKKLFKGRIARAVLYDRALTPEELRASASGDPNYVSPSVRLAAMTAREREEQTRWRDERSQVQERLQALDSQDANPSEWADLAHAMFNLKEFLYLP